MKSGATWVAAALALALVGAVGCEWEREPEGESAQVEQVEAEGEREPVAVTEEEAETPPRSATASQAGELDNVEGGHELALEGDQVEIETR